MAPEFRYSLTRICLRTGNLSLSQRMAEVFPASGTVEVLDTVDDRVMELRVDEPRKVSGLTDFLQRHRLAVNDQIQIRRLADGQLALTALPRSGRRAFDEIAVAELLDSLVGQVPRTEAEIRALYPQIPNDYPLGRALVAHPALRLRGGRWAGEVEGETTTPSEVVETASGRGVGGEEADAPAREAREPTAGGAEDYLSSGPVGDDKGDEVGSDLADRTGADRRGGGTRGRVAADVESGPLAGREGRKSRDRQAGRAAAVTPYPRGVLFPGEAALNSQRPAADLRLVNRAREALTGFGYRVEGLPHGMLLAKADLGRRQHTVLVRVLADGERLDWAALLARRREQTANYLAVLGDHRDLHRLTAPAELARATLWSWDGVARVQNLAQTVLIGPYDLEPHFAKDGMFGTGLQQFERSLGRMIAEKGSLSAVIARLGSLRAPAVFVLDDLVEGDLQREQVAKALDLLSQAPFHLVAKVDRGEYCLRHEVADSLAHLAEYALSVSQRLPRAGVRRMRLVAAGGPADEEQTRSAQREGFELAEDA